MFEYEVFDMLEGQFFIVMLSMVDSWFEYFVIYLCLYFEQGVMGLVVNQVVCYLFFEEFFI